MKENRSKAIGFSGTEIQLVQERANIDHCTQTAESSMQKVRYSEHSAVQAWVSLATQIYNSLIIFYPFYLVACKLDSSLQSKSTRYSINDLQEKLLECTTILIGEFACGVRS